MISQANFQAGKKLLGEKLRDFDNKYQTTSIIIKRENPLSYKVVFSNPEKQLIWDLLKIKNGEKYYLINQKAILDDAYISLNGCHSFSPLRNLNIATEGIIKEETVFACDITGGDYVWVLLSIKEINNKNEQLRLMQTWLARTSYELRER